MEPSERDLPARLAGGAFFAARGRGPFGRRVMAAGALAAAGFLSLLVPAPARAIESAAPQRLTELGPRPLGMGGAFAAVPGDPIGLWYNPAAALRTDKASISGNHSLRHFPHGRKNLDQFDSDTVGLVVPLSGDRTFGYGFTMPGELGVDYRDTNGVLEGGERYRSREERIAWADSGASGKSTLAPIASHGWSRYEREDGGGAFRGFETGGGLGYYHEGSGGVSWGASLTGLLGVFKKNDGKEKGERLALRVGMSWRPDPAADTLAAVDLAVGRREGPALNGEEEKSHRDVRLHAGVERGFDGKGFVRAGWHDGAPSYGFGGKFGSLLLDYAVVKGLLPAVSGENTGFQDGHFLSYTFVF